MPEDADMEWKPALYLGRTLYSGFGEVSENVSFTIFSSSAVEFFSAWNLLHVIDFDLIGHKPVACMIPLSLGICLIGTMHLDACMASATIGDVLLHQIMLSEDVATT